ncbi:hypothetical protein HYFRA_00010763 [Hymenoscyphus fraxineus]|uniref:Uncharacterized protein n=1 Tax=Hymenoscyphus fraxineus TaxID=746836 RepID=A0A9N9PW29_9HELO|nr:hypothetical protein HYFRA_00010763 [Hymenoscyphus fraxineus]
MSFGSGSWDSVQRAEFEVKCGSWLVMSHDHTTTRPSIFYCIPGPQSCSDILPSLACQDRRPRLKGQAHTDEGNIPRKSLRLQENSKEDDDG